MFWFCDCSMSTRIASSWSQPIVEMMMPLACSMTARIFIARDPHVVGRRNRLDGQLGDLMQHLIDRLVADEAARQRRHGGLEQWSRLGHDIPFRWLQTGRKPCSCQGGRSD